MNIAKLLEYQQKDFEIIKLENELNKGDNKKIVSEMISLIKEAQNKSIQLDKKALELDLEYKALLKSYDENSASLESLTRKTSENLNENEILSIENVANIIATNLNLLEKKLTNLAENINTILNQFENTKKIYNNARTKHAQYKNLYEKQQKEIQPKIDKIIAELKTIEKEIDEKLIVKYKNRRQDKKFPIFVPLNGEYCGGCSTQLSKAVIGNLKEKGFIDCENCRRIIYSN